MLTGLRGRFVAAMALVSTITLAVTAVALFSPLERRLRDDVIDGMTRAVHADRLTFTLLDRDSLVPHSPGLIEIVRSLRRGSGADISIVGPGGEVLLSTDRDEGLPSPAALSVLRTGTEVRDTVGSDTREEAQVVTPMTVDGERIAVELRRPLDTVSSAVRVVRDAFLVAAGASLLVALLVGTLLAGRLVRRLRRLRDTALRVADLGPVAEVHADASRDEVGDLTRALTTMQDRLREQEQTRRSFVATASHELRTPLASMTILLDTLRQDLEGPDVDLANARDVTARAEAQADRLSSLAAELLDLSRLDAGLPLRSEPVQVDEVVRSVVAEFDARLVAGDREVAMAADASTWALGDPGSVARIVGILVDNALRHAPSSARVDVHTEHAGDRVTVRVRDYGPGVPESDRERIFARFDRGSQARASGFGLGLAIARELARGMGGDITLEIPDDNTPGVAFVLALPSVPEP